MAWQQLLSFLSSIDGHLYTLYRCLLQNYSVTISSFSCFVVKAWDGQKAGIIMLQNRTCREKGTVNHELARI
jgi:hypothetical protein